MLKFRYLQLCEIVKIIYFCNSFLYMIINLKHMKNNRQTKKLYSPPITTIVELESEPLLQGGSSITGSAPDSDDSEFGAPASRRGEWGNLWNE